MSKKFSFLILCVVLLAALCGCQKKENLFPDFPFDSETLASLESMYGKSLEEVREEWHLSEKDMTERVAGVWYLKNPAVMKGKEFTQSLLTNIPSDTLYGFECMCYCDSAKEAAELAEAFYLDGIKAYGTPSGYFPLSLSLEGAFDEIRNPKDTKYNFKYERWYDISELSQFDLDIYVWEAEKYYAVRLTHRRMHWK